jgi:hypothetical protein
MHRLSQALFAFLQTVASGPGTDQLPRRNVGIGDLHGQELAGALELRNHFFPLSTDLKLVPDRLTQTPTLQAAGFADSRSRSVGVDIARWSRPCAPDLDEIAWRRVFTWIVGADRNLTNVSILEPPTVSNGRVSGTYGYDADRVPGYGVLHVALAEDGAWQICDCWGDAADADRIDALAGRDAH